MLTLSLAHCANTRTLRLTTKLLRFHSTATKQPVLLSKNYVPTSKVKGSKNAAGNDSLRSLGYLLRAGFLRKVKFGGLAFYRFGVTC